MKVPEILSKIDTFKKGVPFTLSDIKSKFPENGGRMFAVGVMFGKIEPNGKYKPIAENSNLTAYLPNGAVLSTPYFVFV